MDSRGNPVAGITVTFSEIYGGGTLVNPVQVSDANGIVTIGASILGPTPGANKIRAQIAGSNFLYSTRPEPDARKPASGPGTE